MKIHPKLLILFLCSLVAVTFASAQSGRVKDAPEGRAGDSPNVDAKDDRTAAQLYEAADKYVQKKFEAFEKLKMPYDEQLERKVKKEQRDLAANSAALLAAR